MVRVKYHTSLLLLLKILGVYVPPKKKKPRSPVINGNHYLSYASVRHAASVSGTRHSRRDSLATQKKPLLEIDRLYMPCNACGKKKDILY